MTGIQRNDMWKLLYSVVSKNQTDLISVFTFVDDILCREPSLIRPYSLRQFNNEIQDAFVKWLINEFIFYLCDPQKKNTKETNINLQKRILSSCYINRSILFQKLVVNYVKAIDELAIELPDDPKNIMINLISFNSKDQCLKNIDSNIKFKAVNIQASAVDALVLDFLNILQHALKIGYEAYPNIFISAVNIVLKAFKECELETKLLCLRYCCLLLEVVIEPKVSFDKYYITIIEALSVFWEQIPIWLQFNFIQYEDLQDCANITSSLLDNNYRFIEVSIDKSYMMGLALNMLTNVSTIAEKNLSVGEDLCLEPLQLSLTSYMVHLQQFDINLPSYDEKTVRLARLTERNPNLWRVIAVMISQHNSKFRVTAELIEEHVNAMLAQSLKSKEYYEFTKELLHLLAYLEQRYLKEKQLRHLRSQNLPQVDDFTSKYILDNYFMRGHTLEEKNKLLNGKIEILLENGNHDSGLFIRYVEILESLLQVASIRGALSSVSLKSVIDFIAKPFKLVINSPSSLNLHRENFHKSMQSLAAVSVHGNAELKAYLSNIILSIITRLFVQSPRNEYIEIRSVFVENMKDLILNGSLSGKDVVNLCLPHLPQNSDNFVRVLKTLCCTMDSNNLIIFRVRKYSCSQKPHINQISELKIVCTKCSPSFSSLESIIGYIKENDALLLTHPRIDTSSFATNSELLNFVRTTFSIPLLHNEQFYFILNHFEIKNIAVESLKLCYESDITKLNIGMLQLFMQKVSTNLEDFLLILSRLILENADKALITSDVSHQLRVLDLISACTVSGIISEQWLFLFFKLTFFFHVHPNSLVAHEAVLCATEMCYKHKVKPIQLWHWYKRDALSLIVKLATHVYLQNGVRLTRSLKMFTKMLGFSCVQEFICKYYRLLTTMILPFCVKEPRCKGIVMCISKVTRKPIAQIFIVSFLRIYSYIYLTEKISIGNKCIDLIVKCTTFSLSKLMNTDIKQTVSEFLIYFNRNPKFVMQAFQCLLLNELNSSRSDAATLSTGFAKFIADRFLGVITYFETCLGEPNFEKSLKEEALYSLGQIIRFVGAVNVTKFRFKIIAMLSFVLTLNDKNLQWICLKIWKIFLHIVNIEKLGPSLSRIVACLQPLHTEWKTEVSSIYEFIILKNDNLLGSYIPGLYFLENIPEVSAEIRHCISRQTEILKSDRSTIEEKLQFLLNQINNENVQVRIYGLLYISNYIAENRAETNRMILHEICVDPIMLNIVDVLVVGIRHEDKKLQLASAKCLGELGAIDPSYMLSKYSLAQANEISLSIHTDEFAVMALTELCRAYQFQKDSKYVDNFSLAIQETLLMCGVSPKDNEKMNVWEAIPERMRPIMKPLLSSCYTGSSRESKCKEHPIFTSSFCCSYEDWAFAWASRLIDFVQTEQTKHLLNSYKPSIKRDSKTLALLFPYIIVHALQDCTLNELQIMFEEFDAVFNFCTQNLIVQPECDLYGVKEFTSIKYLADRNTGPSKAAKFENKKDLENLTISCSKLCSEQIDFLQRWLREWQRSSIVGGKLGEPSKHFQSVKNFVKKFDKHLIAQANYKSGEYARALIYLEAYIEEDVDNRLQDQLSFLIEIHGNLMDADSVEGAVYMKKSNLSLTEEIFVNKIVDRPQESIACYEQLMSSEEQIDQKHVKGMLNCYLRLDIPETALLIADGLWQKLTEQYTDDYFKECKSELLWRLCRYDDLQEILDDSVVRSKTSNWNVQCSEAFLLFRQPQLNGKCTIKNFNSQIDIIRSNILSTMTNFSALMQNSYANSYEEVIKLHILHEVEQSKTLLIKIGNNLEQENCDKNTFINEILNFFVDWEARLCILQPIVRVIEPILCFRRNILIETKRSLSSRSFSLTGSDAFNEVNELINNEIGKLWIRSAQINRFSGNLQQAHLSIMKAEEYKLSMTFLEKAKLLWDKGDQSNSFKLIQENIEHLEEKCKKNIRNLDVSDQGLYAEAKFLQATFNAESMNICSELNLRYFKEAILGNKQSEKCYVHFAQYIEKIYESFTTHQQDGENGQKQLLNIMVNYARSLKCGVENVYQSMPRLLSKWLDFTARCASSSEIPTTSESATSRSFQELAKKMNDLITSCCEALPTWAFYTAFSQLLSRICHPSNEVFHVLRSIVVKLVGHYPHQSLWMLLPIFKSSYSNRVKRCRLILTDSRLNNEQFQKLLTDFNMLAERLIELTNKDVPIERSYELSFLAKQLPILFKDKNFSKILLPFEKYMQVSLPISPLFISQKLNFSATSSQGSNNSTIPLNPFPYEQIYITGIKEEVTVLRSAAKPKKITLECNDGLHYEVMVKPKDDLRKDFRLMEFNGLVKRFLHQDPQARYRRLLIRTYAAIPFNEECGLVEWLPNLNSFRNICVSIYRVRGLGIKDIYLRKFALPQTETIEKKRHIFVETLLPRHPPVFHEWIRQRFPTPHSWHEARSSYVRTLAVMSMVGYILGLGDRHGENILFDEMSGHAVHVDFNCLFNQGESFAYPEVVPFRLTHNMVFAMGPLGVEGIYRKSCEITLRLLKKETKTLLSVLRPFVYDVVVLNRSYSSKKSMNAEVTDPKAMNDVRRIEERLQGYVNKTLANSMPLSVEGQVNFLISEATNIDNLASMYIGWGSYI